MSLSEYPYSQPIAAEYRQNAPLSIQPLDDEHGKPIIEAWDKFFTGEEPMTGVHMGILVRNLIELSGGRKDLDGISETIILNPGGDAEHIRFQHRASPFVAGGEATVEIVSNQGHGRTVEHISWGRNLTSGRPSTTPVIARTHYIEGLKFRSLAAQASDSYALTPVATVQEAPQSYDIDHDGKLLFGKAFRFVAKRFKPTPLIA